MSFKVKARTLLHLGRDLISSDAVAFYELIKNAFDAASRDVTITLIINMTGAFYTKLRDELDREIPDEPTELSNTDDYDLQAAQREDRLKIVRELFLASIESRAPDADFLKRSGLQAESVDELRELVVGANRILIRDNGEGMSVSELDDVFLTIGTRSRQKHNQALRSGKLPTGPRRNAYMGEKGVGRLSAMRLGNRLKVATGRPNDTHWNNLEIDWSLFSHDSDADMEDIHVAPYIGDAKNPAESGTLLTISDLASSWTASKIQEIATHELSRFLDPFQPNSGYRIIIRYNGEPISIPDFNELLYKAASAFVTAEFIPTGSPEIGALDGTIEYIYRSKKTSFKLEGAHLISAAGNATEAVLRSLGPFTVRFYWFNRALLDNIDGLGDITAVKAVLNQWAGGLMVYRDGVRVSPYGSPQDDWLGLDPVAFRAGGYKVNRRQIVGKVDISAIENPHLVDQTNREGLRDCPEKSALIFLLQHILWSEFKKYIERVDDATKDLKAQLDLSIVDARVETEKSRVEKSIQLLIEKYPDLADERTALEGIRLAIKNIEEMTQQIRDQAVDYEDRLAQSVHLAGIGLMVEFVAHELNRVVSNSLTTLAEAKSTEGIPNQVKGLFRSMERQLNTLGKRLRILDPLNTVARQRKENFDLVGLIRDIIDAHEGQFKRHGVGCKVQVVPAQDRYVIHAVPGMFVQIIENLISNSVYWLNVETTLNPDFIPQIEILVDTRGSAIRFTDNGPGIPPNRADAVFQPFVTTKPAKQGKGLGLYIARELAQYNGFRLDLSDESTVHPSSLNTFILSLEAHGA